MIIHGLILCEGETDQILIGYYLSKMRGWKYSKKEGMPFADKKVLWYVDPNGQVLGIWSVGGNDFLPAIEKVFTLERIEHSLLKLAIVTDHDDKAAEDERLASICQKIKRTIQLIDFDEENFVHRRNSWQPLNYFDSFSSKAQMQFCYMLVPLDEQGALETYMLNALSENNKERSAVISQVRAFLCNFESDIFLKKRRERRKAELGVSVAIFSPDKVFTTINELLFDVNWENFSTTHSQFCLLCDI